MVVKSIKVWFYLLILLEKESVIIMKKALYVILSIVSGILLFTAIPVMADTSDGSGQPTEFQTTDISEIVGIIDDYYTPNVMTRAAAGTKWAAGSVVSDGNEGQYVTNYFWVRGSDMVSWNIVGAAQRKAVIQKYGSVNASTSYKMKTTQHIVKVVKVQTQGYVTVSATAVCYAKD